MAKFMIVTSLLLAAAACGGNKGDTALKEFEGFRDKMCACTEKGCAEKVQSQWREWRKHVGVKKDELSDDQKARAKKIDGEMDACRDKVRNAAR